VSRRRAGFAAGAKAALRRHLDRRFRGDLFAAPRIDCGDAAPVGWPVDRAAATWETPALTLRQRVRAE
jgi:hypothetical protein